MKYEKIFELLFSAIVNYPILKNVGAHLQKLPVVVFDPSGLVSAKDFLLKNGIMISDELCTKDLFEILHNSSAGFVIYHYVAGKKTNLFLNRLSKMVKTGTTGTHDVRTLPLVISDTVPIVDDRDDIFVININGSTPFEQLDLTTCIPPDDMIASIMETLQTRDWKCENHVLNALKAAAHCLLPCLRARDQDEMLSSYFSLAEDLVELDDEDDSVDGITEIFTSALEGWGVKMHSPKVIPLPDISMDAAKDLENSVLFDEKYCYLSDHLFHMIVAPILPSVPITAVKRELWHEHVIVTSDKKTFSSKMGYRTVVGIWKRKRMIRLSREKMRRPGKMDFIDFLKSSKEVNLYET